MAFEDATCWVVQGGPRGRYVDGYVRGGVVSTGWEYDDLGDLTATEDAEIFLQLEARGRRKPADDLRDLRIFTDRMVPGDVVVVADTAAADLLFGEVEGAYAYDPLGGDHRHVRPTRWFGRLAVDQVDPLLAKGASVRQPVKRLPEQLHWQRLAGDVDDLLGRPVDDVPTRPPAQPRRVSGTRRARTARPATPATPDRLCTACGLLRAPTQFGEGEDVCRDCA